MENCFVALSFHSNKVFLTLDLCSLTLRNFILTLENLGQRVNDPLDSEPSENSVIFNVSVLFVNNSVEEEFLKY